MLFLICQLHCQFPVPQSEQCIYNLIKMNYSSEVGNAEEIIANGNKKPQSRDFKCPCGKTYLSYAALFTHIKQKHDGKAPGQIEKPKTQSKPRGRPPLAAKNKLIILEKDSQKCPDMATKIMEQNGKNQVYECAYLQIFHHLNQLYCPQDIDMQIWEKVSSFKIFQQFIDNNQDRKKSQFQGVNVGYGLSQFLKGVSLQTQPWRFEQVLLLFMLLLQYVIDECNSEELITEAPIQILVEYMNPFLNYHIEDYAELLHIDTLWIMDKSNIHNIFLCFYNWLKWKEYTSFCITILD